MAKTYEWIGRYTTVAGEYSFSMSAIPQNYTDLIMQLDGTFTGDNILEVIINGNASGLAWVCRWQDPNTNSVLSDTFSGYSRIARLGDNTRIELFNYSTSGTYKAGLYHSTGYRPDATAATIQFGAVQSNVTTPITSVGFRNYTTNAFTTGTTLDLWGIRSA